MSRCRTTPTVARNQQVWARQHRHPDHGNGWTSAYGHMLKGSVLVKEGDQVTAGQPLGMVGLSA
jgi:biotin carboxyl carrier protein